MVWVRVLGPWIWSMDWVLSPCRLMVMVDLFIGGFFSLFLRWFW